LKQNKSKITMKKIKIIKAFNIDEDAFEKFRLMTKVLGYTQSEIINDFINNYTVTHKAEFNDLLKTFSQKNNLS